MICRRFSGSVALFSMLFTYSICVTPPALAQEYVWSGTTSSNWSVTSNWVGGVAPPIGGDGAISLRFTASGNTLYTATNNRGNPFTADRVVFDTTSTSLIQVASAMGNNLRLIGSNPTIQMVGQGNARIGGFSTPGALVLNNTAPALDLQVLSLNGANTITGGVTLQSGNLELASNGALGSGTLTINGGTLRASGSIIPTIGSNPIVLNADLNYLGGDNATTLLRFNQASILSGSGGVLHRGQGTLDIQGSSTYTGATVVRETSLGYRFSLSDAVGILSLSGAAGAITASSEVKVAGGATLRLDNTSGSNFNRIGDTASITLGSGFLLFTPGSGGIEQVGSLNLDGFSVVQASQTASGPESGLTFTTFSRGGNRGTILFRGDNLGTTARIRLGAGPVADLVGGGGAAGSTTISVLPYAVGNVNVGGLPDTFVTYDGTGGVRPLSTAELATGLSVGSVTDQNVRLGEDVTVSAPTTVNSLLLRDDSTFSSPVTVNGTATLTVRSGLVLSTRQFNRINTPLAFGSREGHVVSTQSLTVAGAMTGTGGLTVSGGGDVTLTGNNTGLTGTFTVNGGTIAFNNTNSLPGTGPILLGGGGFVTGGVDVASLTYTGASNSSLTLSRGFRLVGMGRIGTTASINGPTITISGLIEGAGTLSLGSADFIVSGANTHTGGTVVSGSGTILVAANTTGSATGSGPVFLRTNGTLAGNGRVAGVVTAEPNTTTNPNATIAPSGANGAGIGRLTAGGLDLRQGRYQWQLGALSESGAGTAFDQLVIEGAGTRLDSSGRVTLDFALLAAGDRPTAVGNGGGFWTTSRQWLILDWTEEGEFSGNFGGVSNAIWTAGTFSLSQGNGDVYLNFTPVPEPVGVICITVIVLFVGRHVRKPRHIEVWTLNETF